VDQRRLFVMWERDPDVLLYRCCVKSATLGQSQSTNRRPHSRSRSSTRSIFQLLTGETSEQVEANFKDKGYAQLKQELADATTAFLEPLQKTVQGIDDSELTRILAEGADRARGIASQTLAAVKEKMGVAGAAR